MAADSEAQEHRQPGDPYGTKQGVKRVRRRTIVVVLVLALIVAGGTALGIWRLTQFTPAEVNIDSAVEGVQSVISEGSGQTNSGQTNSGETNSGQANSGETNSGEASPVGAAADLTGEWLVDNSIGTFTYESATGSFAGFRVEEELVRIGHVTAVGRTDEVSGSLRIDGTTLAAATVSVDLSTITTNDSRRDDNVYRALHADEFPLATFELSQPIDIASSLSQVGADGQEGEVRFRGAASGLLTINGISVPTTFELTARTLEDVIVVIGSADITFADFDVTTPGAGIVAQADEFGVIEFQLLFRRA